uniref:Uncharacterized protein n=1 Tax=Rhizophora mucronata TaxID=61149 RepID=A0A2P2NLZ2_RHIMU
MVIKDTEQVKMANICKTNPPLKVQSKTS